MKVSELIKCLQIDENGDEPIDPDAEVRIATAFDNWVILSIYVSETDGKLWIDIGREDNDSDD